MRYIEVTPFEVRLTPAAVAAAVRTLTPDAGRSEAGR
jgi:hypothetical protein